MAEEHEVLGVAQEDLRLVNSSTVFTYNKNERYQVSITGGSGTGALVFSVENITGKGTITQSGAFTFLAPGTVWVKIYKEKSTVGDTEYQQSKTLVVEVTLAQRSIKVSVLNDIVRQLGDPIPDPSSAGYKVEGLASGDVLSRAPTLYFVTSPSPINIWEISDYPIAAKNAKVPTTGVDGYNPKIQYRSKTLYYKNQRQYRITASCNDWTLGSVSASSSYALPYSEVRFTVSANRGATFIDSSIHVYGNSGTLTPTVIDIEKDSGGRYQKGVYSFIMPISNVSIYIEFLTVGATGTDPYGPNPYMDVNDSFFASTASPYVDYHDYMHALIFCYYANKFYYPAEETLRIMGGVKGETYPGTHDAMFYDVVDGVKDRVLIRRDLINTLHRLSHCYDVKNTATEEQILSNPDYYFYQSSSGETYNTPYARLYSYPIFTFKNHPCNYDDPLSFNSTVETTGTEEVFSNDLGHNVYAGNYARDDYMGNTSYLQPIAWGSWIGAMNGYTEHSFGPKTGATFQEAVTVLWRYARFRQKDVRGDSAYMMINDEEAEEWARNGPIKWALSCKIAHKYTPTGELQTLNTLIDRAEWGYMLMRFCQQYGW